MSEASWHEDVQSLVFQPLGHEGNCFIHRRALETLCDAATIADYLHYYAEHRSAIHRAAADKIRDAHILGPTNLHLNSRDIARAIDADSTSCGEPGR